MNSDSTLRTMPSSRVPAGKRKRQDAIPERLLADLWRKRAARQAWLRTGGGARVRVVYPGRAGHSAGPDFRNALLEIEGLGLVQGDVEIHLRQRDWYSHGHGKDPNYNGVVLHAALEVDSSVTSLQSGQQAPVVCLAALLEGEDPGRPACPQPVAATRKPGVPAARHATGVGRTPGPGR